MLLIWCVSFLCVGTLSILVWTWKKRFRSTEDVVLHQLPRGPKAPSLSPFPLKLETYLRIVGIPYQAEFSTPFSSKGKTPWITFKGKPIADSQMCLQFLNKQFQCNLNAHLSEEHISISRAFQKLIEENLYWCMCALMFGPDLDNVRQMLPYNWIKSLFVTYYLHFVIRLELWGHGMGRHTIKEIKEIGRHDLQALSTYLGDKPYFMGSTVSEVDCALFGLMSQLKWHAPQSYFSRLVKDEMPNLFTYCDRMKSIYWTDWNDHLQ